MSSYFTSMLASDSFIPSWWLRKKPIFQVHKQEIAFCKICKTLFAFYQHFSSCSIFPERSFLLFLLFLLLMIQVTFSVVNRNEMTLTPHGANLYFNKILITTEIGNKLLRVGSDEYLRLAEAKGMKLQPFLLFWVVK